MNTILQKLLAPVTHILSLGKGRSFSIIPNEI